MKRVFSIVLSLLIVLSFLISTAFASAEATTDTDNDVEIELDKLFVNNSYITGLNCDIKKEAKYFEF